MPQASTSSRKLDRREGVKLIRAETGLPFSLSTFRKECARRRGPPAVAVWGGRHFYTEDDVRRWARQRARAQEA